VGRFSQAVDPSLSHFSSEAHARFLLVYSFALENLHLGAFSLLQCLPFIISSCGESIYLPIDQFVGRSSFSLDGGPPVVSSGDLIFSL
jgi:hypothetical protein